MRRLAQQVAPVCSSGAVAHSPKGARSAATSRQQTISKFMQPPVAGALIHRNCHKLREIKEDITAPGFQCGS
jgi:hypothetical protein